MKFKDLLKKLKSSPQYESFSSAYKDAFIVAGFFVLDNEGKQNIYQIDYFVPSKNKIAAFSIENPVSMQMLDSQANKEPLKELSPDANIELEAIEGILDDEMKNRGISESIKKIVAVLHTNSENKKLWNLNCMLSGMTLLRAHVDDDSKTVLKMEKVNLFDVMKTMPNPNKIKSAQPDVDSQSSQAIQLDKMKPLQKKQLIKGEIDKLDKLESAIEKEKKLLQEEISKYDKKSPKSSKPVKRR